MGKYDVIIIGAGAAGLMAARSLSEANKKICVLEARDRIGGRIHTLQKKGFSKAVEAGGEFVHGKLPLTLKMLKDAGIKYYETEGELWQVKNNALVKRKDFIEHAGELQKKLKKLVTDMSVNAFLHEYFSEKKYAGMKRSLQQYIEGYDAGNINLYSALALKEEWENEEEEQYRLEGGYGPLLHYLAKACREKGSVIILSTVVKKINWRVDHVEVITMDDKVLFAAKVIVTVPLPMLSNPSREAGISFYPALPVVAEAAGKIGYGGVVKIVMEFTHAFWETGETKADNLFFLFSEEVIPTWWSQLPDTTPRLCGWLGGPKADELADIDDETILGKALHSLSSIFGIPVEILQQFITGTHIHNWVADRFSKGAYSYTSVTTSAAKALLRTPIAGTLFFAGEALAKNSNATVEAAFESGKEVAEMILS